MAVGAVACSVSARMTFTARRSLCCWTSLGRSCSADGAAYSSSGVSGCDSVSYLSGPGSPLCWSSVPSEHLWAACSSAAAATDCPNAGQSRIGGCCCRFYCLCRTRPTWSRSQRRRTHDCLSRKCAFGRCRRRVPQCLGHLSGRLRSF